MRKKAKRNPLSPADRRALATAKRLAKQFHGSAGEVYELSPTERRAPPRFVVGVGRLAEVVYAPERGQRSPFRWRHTSGDRGVGKPAGKRKPLLAVDPRTRRPIWVQDRSGMRFSSRRGLIG